MLANTLYQRGSSLYKIVFVVYVATTFQSKLLISISNMILMVSIFFQFWLAQKADATVHKAKGMIIIGWIEGLFFMIVAYLTGQVSMFAFSVICLLNIYQTVLLAFIDISTHLFLAIKSLKIS